MNLQRVGYKYYGWNAGHGRDEQTCILPPTAAPCTPGIVPKEQGAPARVGGVNTAKLHA